MTKQLLWKNILREFAISTERPQAARLILQILAKYFSRYTSKSFNNCIINSIWIMLNQLLQTLVGYSDARPIRWFSANCNQFLIAMKKEDECAARSFKGMEEKEQGEAVKRKAYYLFSWFFSTLFFFSHMYRTVIVDSMTMGCDIYPTLPGI